jgi:hypothetical protein
VRCFCDINNLCLSAAYIATAHHSIHATILDLGEHHFDFIGLMPSHRGALRFMLLSTCKARSHVQNPMRGSYFVAVRLVFQPEAFITVCAEV